MPTRALLCLLCLQLLPTTAAAQFIDDTRESFGFDTPEAWAMAYVTSSTLMTGHGETPALDPGGFALSAELGHIPRLDDDQQRVGFGGFKSEDLNKSPVFGRARLWIGLPAGFVGEIAWTPPVEIDGVKPSDLFAIGIGRRWIDRDSWSLSTRAHAQSGSAQGDITCPQQIAGNTDPEINPFRCAAPSEDRIKLRYYALEATAAYGAAQSDWRAHASVGLSRYEPRVQVNARSRNLISIPRLSTKGTAPYLALGTTYRFDPRWELSGEVLYVPLDVRREEDGAVENDPFWSARLMLRYRFGH
jgi:hypothetical protein